MAFDKFHPKDPGETDYRVFVWCSKNGRNDGTVYDTGDLQGATISGATVTVEAGLTKDSQNTNAITIRDIAYEVNTTVTVWLSGGTIDTDYDINCEIETSDGRTLQKTAVLRVESL